MKPEQLDLFAWADARPSAEVISAIPGIAARVWRELYQPRKRIDGTVLEFRPVCRTEAASSRPHDLKRAAS